MLIISTNEAEVSGLWVKKKIILGYTVGTVPPPNSVAKIDLSRYPKQNFIQAQCSTHLHP